MCRYRRKQALPKDGGKVRILSIPAIRYRVVQGALKLILEPVFEADFQPGSFAYRPKRTAQKAVSRVAQAIVQQKTRVVDIDLRNYFGNVRHDQIAAKGNGACLAWFGVLQNWSIPRTSKARFCNFQWFEGRCDVHLRNQRDSRQQVMALYQQKKGRDLFDLAIALQHSSMGT
jgi:hypothetical protein